MRRVRFAVAAVAACLLVPSVALADNLRVESTTDTVDAGLVEDLLRQAYKAAQPGDDLAYHAVGTGAALDNARAGTADVVITHAPLLEAQFVKDGYSLGLGRQIFYSDYVIVGPTNDPAQVLTKHPHDAVGAFEDIAAAGAANSNTVQFKSRWDNSGTNVQEQIMWKLSNVAPQSPAFKAPSDPQRAEPGAGTGQPGYPAWYKAAVAGQAANLLATENCVINGNGCYTMIDRGTFNRNLNNGTVTHLKIVAEKNTPGTRGGENLLINPFSIYLVNPDKISTDPKPNTAAGTRFRDFLVSPGFQAALLGFPTAVDPAFLPDAFPALALAGGLPQTAVTGSTVTLTGSAKSRLPGAGAIGGLPVQLQQSTDGGATWTNTGAAAPSGADGTFSLPFTVGATANYRLATPVHPASAYNEFTPTTQDLGVITATPAPVTPPPAAKDTTKPTATKVVLGRRGLSLRVSEASTVKLVIGRRVRKGKKISYAKVQTLTVKATKARSLSLKHRTLKAGRYRVQVTVTDLAGNRKALTRNFNVK